MTEGTCHMVNIATLSGQVHLYVVHKVDEAEVRNMLEYHHDVEEGDVQGDVEGDVSKGVQSENEEHGGEVDEGVQVQNEDDGGEVHEAVQNEIEEHGGELDGGVQVENEVDGCEVHGGVEVENVDDGGQVHEVVQSQNEEHRGEVDGGVEVENAHEGDVDKDDVSSCSESTGDSFIEYDLLDVSIHNYEDEDDSWDSDGHSSVDFGGVSGHNTHAADRDLSDTDWPSESLNNVEYNDYSRDDRDSYGHFGIFSMPKSMEASMLPLSHYYEVPQY